MEVSAINGGKLLKVSEAAKLLNTSPITIRRWLTTGKLAGFKLGKRWRVREADVQGMLQAFEPSVNVQNRHIQPILTGDEAYLESVGISFKY